MLAHNQGKFKLLDKADIREKLKQLDQYCDQILTKIHDYDLVKSCIDDLFKPVDKQTVWIEFQKLDKPIHNSVKYIAHLKNQGGIIVLGQSLANADEANGNVIPLEGWQQPDFLITHLYCLLIQYAKKLRSKIYQYLKRKIVRLFFWRH